MASFFGSRRSGSLAAAAALAAAALALLAAPALAGGRPRRARRPDAPTQCPDPTDKGCGALTWPVSWSMRGSLYAYCYITCPLDYFDSHRELGVFAGVVGLDHYVSPPVHRTSICAAMA